MNAKDAQLLLEKDPELACQLALFSLENNSDMWEALFDQGLSQALHKTKDQGIGFMHKAGNLKPELFVGILDKGWGEKFIGKFPLNDKDNEKLSSITTCNYFLSNLIHLRDTEIIQRALKSFFKDCDADLVTRHLLSEPVNTTCPIAKWLNNSYHDGSHVNGAEIKFSVQKQLLRTSRDIGFDWDKTFDRSTLFVREQSDWAQGVWKVGPNEKQTILSLLVGMGQNTENTVDPQTIKITEMVLNEGKCFDKSTATTIVRMNPSMARTWIDFFVDRGDVSAVQVAAMTSRIKMEPNTKALLSSMAAKESIDLLFKEYPSP